MKNIFTTLLFLTIIFTGDIMAQNKIDNQGKKQGNWFKTYENGNKIYEGKFVNDYQEGLFTYYYENGDIKANTIFSSKGRIAITKIYNTDGGIMSEGAYYNKFKDGEWIYYDQKGNKLKRENYDKGIKRGDFKVWDKNGLLVESIEYKDDKKNGVYYKNFYSKGYVYYTYKDNKKTGPYEDYYYFQKLRVKGNYNEDMRDNNWLYYDSLGNIIKTQEWRKDSLLKENIRIQYSDNVEYIDTRDIAYFYPKGSEIFIALNNSKTINCINNFEDFLPLISIDDFLLINKQYKIYSRYSALKGISPASGGEYYINLQPKSNNPIITDKESRKALENIFSK